MLRRVLPYPSIIHIKRYEISPIQKEFRCGASDFDSGDRTALANLKQPYRLHQYRQHGHKRSNCHDQVSQLSMSSP